MANNDTMVKCWCGTDKVGMAPATSVIPRGGSRIFSEGGRLVQRGGIFRVGGRHGLMWCLTLTQEVIFIHMNTSSAETLTPLTSADISRGH